jgi:hypothetical protein
MNTREIEHMWKVASNNPNHDTNWHDPVVVAFAKMVAAHTLMNIDPSNFMSHQEGIEAGRLAEREACAEICRQQSNLQLDERVMRGIDVCKELILARGQA